MTKKETITEATIQKALSVLQKRIAEPPPPQAKQYSRKQAFLKLKAAAKEAMAVGHTLETVLDDLKGVGLGMTIATARQYMKPGRKSVKPRAATPTIKSMKPPPKQLATAPTSTEDGKKGTFAVTEDEREI